MPIDAQCGSCTTRYRVVDSAAGRRVKCRRCGNAIDLPGQAAPVDPFAVLSELEKTARPVAASPDAALIQYRAVMSTVAPPKTVESATVKHGTSITDLQPGGVSALGARKRKREGSAFKLPGGRIIPLALLGVVLLLAGLSFISPIFALILMAVAYLVMLAGGLWGLIVAFRESIVCGLLCLFIGIYALYYLITRWDEMKYPFLVQIAGFGLLFLGAFLAHPGHMPFAEFIGQ
jgi:predicted Zn finger-like uncharacterized protein